MTTKRLLTEAGVDALFAEMVRAVGGGASAESTVIASRDDDPKTARAILAARFRAALEDEIVIAEDTNDGKINDAEVQREVVKKALVGLKADRLRAIARARKIAVGGRIEELAERIAAALDWNEKEIALLVLASSETLSVERGYASRLYFLRDDIADNLLAPWASTLKDLEDKFLRVGVAKWFVFDEVDVQDSRNRVVVRGTLRSYKASVSDVWGQPELSAVPDRDQHVQVVIEAGNSHLEVDCRTASSARAAIQALEASLRLELMGYVPNAEAKDSSRLVGAVHGKTEFMLDILENRLKSTGLRDLNLTSAKFQVGAQSDGEDEVDSVRPILRAVTFEGQHLLDSVSACRLIARDRRALVDMNMRVWFRRGTNNAQFAAKITIESDHMLVGTGYGSDPLLALEAHRAVISSVVAEVRNGVDDESRLANLIQRITERADEAATPEVATMLVEEETPEVPPLLAEEETPEFATNAGEENPEAVTEGE